LGRGSDGRNSNRSIKRGEGSEFHDGKIVGTSNVVGRRSKVKQQVRAQDNK
jgi:hypothetical protein